MLDINHAAMMEINFDDFKPVPMPRSKVHQCILTAHPNGKVSLNKAFREEILSKSDSFHLGFNSHKTDPRVFLIFVSESPNYTFSRGDGGRIDEDFTRDLVKKGVELPAKYEFRWNEEADAWVGILCGDLNPRAKSASLEAERKRRRKKHDGD